MVSVDGIWGVLKGSPGVLELLWSSFWVGGIRLGVVLGSRTLQSIPWALSMDPESGIPIDPLYATKEEPMNHTRAKIEESTP